MEQEKLKELIEDLEKRKKKQQRVIKILIVLIILLSIVLVALGIVEKAQKNEMEATITQSDLDRWIKDIEIIAVGESGDIIYSDEIELNNVNYAYNIWYKIPEELREGFKNNEWKVVITEYSIGDLFEEYAGAVAVTVPELKTIYIENRQKTFRTCLVHEFGHYLDSEMGGISQTEEFEKLYEDEKDSLYEVENYNDNGKSSVEEFFAETYEQYVLYPELLKNTCKETYKFFESLLERD